MLSKPTNKTGAVLIEVLRERKAQDKRWGEQNHPMIGGEGAEYTRASYAGEAAEQKAQYDREVQEGRVGWDTIIQEEVYEALPESDPRKIRAELVQVAAVAVAMIESLDRNELSRG